ncbi:hypothetical protein [Mycolicibacterium vanbaalenii]|uniref:hypothetical protein n=1 Tax=Mycolicibacterium vanbaalenii TaxID=110539 RepID=UPI0023BA5D87|nr:hypothetical protein [Mycolicibacterium vanbaalenii]
MVGFGLPIIVMGAASLLMIPAMIAASGKVAWGVIALGQTIGAIGGVVVGYGWGWFGPSIIARNSPTGRRKDYLESIVARGVLLMPAIAVATVAAYVLAPTLPLFAVGGALYAVLAGLDASWYFIGQAKPYALLAFDTLPRVAGVALALGLMISGYSALVGQIGMCAGSLLAFASSTTRILRETKRQGAERSQLRAPWTVLATYRHGVASAFFSSTYRAAPLAIVSVTAPDIQPAFAIADKVKAQFLIASSPAITILQGWVPRGAGSNQARRANAALLSTLAFILALGIGISLLVPSLVSWLGNGQISLSRVTVALLSACVSVAVFESVLERAVLATFRQLRVVALALVAGSSVGLLLVALGAAKFGTAGALGGVLAGSLVCVAIELVAYTRVMRHVVHVDTKEPLRAQQSSGDI